MDDRIGCEDAMDRGRSAAIGIDLAGTGEWRGELALIEVEARIEEILDTCPVPGRGDRLVEDDALVAFQIGATGDAIGAVARRESDHLARAAFIEHLDVAAADAGVGQRGLESTRIIAHRCTVKGEAATDRHGEAASVDSATSSTLADCR